MNPSSFNTPLLTSSGGLKVFITYSFVILLGANSSRFFWGGFLKPFLLKGSR